MFHSNALPLEVYVANGLPREWISKWSLDSLKAGAVAYRSYGVWYTRHPMSLNPRVDICDSDACQVFKPDAATPKSLQAEEETAGIVLSSGGSSVLRAEYAAETNGLANPGSGCPDGYTGQINNMKTGAPLPERSQWPCMKDAINAGAPALLHETNHGRGMSQRGSQRWATGTPYHAAKATINTPWQCILDHYYNDNGDSTQGLGGARDAYMANSPGDGLSVNSGSTGLAISNLDGSNLQTPVPGFWATWSPGQKHLLIYGASGSAGWEVLNTATGVASQLPSGIHGMDRPPQVSWSPAGNTLNDDQGLIVYTNGNDLYTMTANGGDKLPVTNNGSTALDMQPSFSSDGTKIADVGETFDGSGWRLNVMNADGSGKSTLVSSAVNQLLCYDPSWSPDGTTIVASCQSSTAPYDYEVYAIATNGSGLKQLTSFSQPGTEPDFAQFTQDGTKIVFTWYGNTTSDIFQMNADGSALTAVDALSNFSSGSSVTRCRRFDFYQ
jgi:hypothetical protein